MTDREYRLRARIDTLMDDAEKLKARVATLERAAERNKKRAERARCSRNKWQKRYYALTGQIVMLRRVNDGKCAGCDQPYDQHTTGCRSCDYRHSKRRTANGLARKHCDGCGVPFDERTAGCAQCKSRYETREKRARARARLTVVPRLRLVGETGGVQGQPPRNATPGEKSPRFIVDTGAPPVSTLIEARRIQAAAVRHPAGGR